MITRPREDRAIVPTMRRSSAGWPSWPGGGGGGDLAWLSACERTSASTRSRRLIASGTSSATIASSRT
jgi:hypothetical protein